MSDRELVAIALTDRRRFQLLYERYADRLYWFAVVRTGSATLADDVVSETMLAVYEQLEQFDPERGEFASWLFAIGRRKAADQRRAYRRLWRFATHNAHRLELIAEEDLLERMVKQEEIGRVYRATRQLSSQDREIIALRYSAGLSGREIAAALGISHVACRKRLSRALKRLEDRLDTA